MAARRPFAPQVIAYWLTSSWIARDAASLSSGGQAKSGKPWARLTAPASTARRFISRMTDSVKLAALAVILARLMRGSVRACVRQQTVRAPVGDASPCLMANRGRLRPPRPDDQRQLELELPVDDALYAWAQDQVASA